MFNLKKNIVAFSVFCALFFAAGFNAFAFTRVLSPVPGTFCNKQPFIVDLSDGAECFYSLTGTSPLDSGLAYDTPFLIDSVGEVELNLVVIKDKRVEDYKIKYKVLPLEESEYNSYVEIKNDGNEVRSELSEESAFFRKISENPIQEIFSDEEFQIPASFKYSFDNETEPYLSGKTLTLSSDNQFFRYMPITCVLGEKALHFVLKVAGTSAGVFSKNEIPFEISDWTNFKFTGKKLIWSIDGGLWSASTKPFYVDRTVPHVISWQDVAYEEGNPISRFQIPAMPKIEASGGGRKKAKFVLKGDASYKMELFSGGKDLASNENNGLFTEITIDTYEGDLINSNAIFAVYSDGVFQGNISVPYIIDKQSPPPPKILSSTSARSISRETVNVSIEGEFGSDIFYAKSEGIKIEDKEKLRSINAQDFFNSVKLGNFVPYKKGTVSLNAANEGAVFYKVAAYAIDEYGNKSDVSNYSIVIDENNFYLSGKKSPYVAESAENGSYLAPFTSFDKILKVINSGKSTKVYVSGVIEVTGGEKKITSNCEFIAEKDARLVFSPNSSLKITASAVSFKGIVLEKRKDVLGLSNTSNFLTLENATGNFNSCEIVGFFADNGIVLETNASVLHVDGTRLTAAGDSYVSGITSSRSKIYLGSSKFSTIGSTSVNFSVANSVFELANCDCKVSGRLGRICEFNSSEVKMRENIFGAELEKTARPSSISAIWKDDGSKIYEDLENKIYGF